MNDYPVTMEQLMEVSRQSTGVYSTHIMQVLASMGYTGKPIGDLHKVLFHDGSPYYLPKHYMSAKEAVSLIRSCGGVVVLAHPGQYKNPMLMELMIEEGMLDGIELHHPRNDKKTMEHIQSLAREHDLFMTGGTDFHGLYTKTPYPLGSFLCPEEGLNVSVKPGKQPMKLIIRSTSRSHFLRKRQKVFLKKCLLKRLNHRCSCFTGMLKDPP